MAEGQLITPEAVEACILELAQFGACGATGVCRTVYSPEWVAAQERLAAWMPRSRTRGAPGRGRQPLARLEGTEPGRRSSPGRTSIRKCPAGATTARLGALAGGLAMRALMARYGQPRRTIEVVSLCEEEGSRFSTAGFWGSRGILGLISPEDLDNTVSFRR